MTGAIKEQEMLRRLLIVSFLVVAFCCVSSGNLLFGQNDASSDEAIKKEVLKVEDERIQSHQQRDRAAMERIYADDLIWTFPTGGRLTKAQFLDIILNEKLKKNIQRLKNIVRLIECPNRNLLLWARFINF